MAGTDHFLVVSHAQQLRWWSPLALVLARRLDATVVAWVLGRHDRRVAEATGYPRVVDLLEGLDPSRARADLDWNLERVRRYEERAGAHLFYEDLAMDRHLASARWDLARVIQYATHVMRSVDAQVEHHGYPVAAMGEANTLPYRLAYRLLRPHLFYFSPTVERSWPHRFYVEQSISADRPACRRCYRQFMEQGMPPDLERMARERLDEFRHKALMPFYSKLQYGDHVKQGGTDPLSRKLRPHRVAGVVSRWVERLLGDDASDPRSVYARSPGQKLVAAAVEYSRKRAFAQIAGPPATDGMEYCTYFLHVEPEYSVEGLAFGFRNQLAVIQNIAGMLPGHMRLYVKEHRPMLGLRTRDFFEALAAIPNVLLLRDDVTAHELIRGSRIVFTLTGTPALEAQLYGVPAVVFGRVYFQSFQGVFRVRSFAELRTTIRAVLDGDAARGDDRSAVAALAALYHSSREGKLGVPYTEQEMHDPDNLQQVVDGIMEDLQAEGVGTSSRPPAVPLGP